MTGKAKVARVNGQVWVTVSSNENFLRNLAEEAKSHSFETELDLSWSPVLKLKSLVNINIDCLKQALQVKGLEVIIL